jgi:hypothetical protein
MCTNKKWREETKKTHNSGELHRDLIVSSPQTQMPPAQGKLISAHVERGFIDFVTAA